MNTLHVSHTAIADLDTIVLSGLTVNCIVGVYGEERRVAQALRVDVELHLDTRPVHSGAGFSGTVDYARLAGELTFLLEACRFRMLESAAEAIARYVLAPPIAEAAQAQVQAVTLTLTKPEALAGRATPSVRIHRRASEYTYLVEEKSFGKVDIVYTAAEHGIYRLRIRPGGHIPTHVHRTMDEQELVLGSSLRLQGLPVSRGTAFHWPHDFPHRYDNPSDIEQTVLCVDSPPFDPADEVEVDVPIEALQPLTGRMLYPEEDAALAR